MTELKSKIILVRDIKLDKKYVNVLSYTESEMLELCQANAVATQDDYSFIRNNGNIFTNFTYSQCLQANYIAFQNKDYSNKWFFAFIDDVIYKGEKNTEIRYSVDSWSTWYDYWTKKNCFINRQHVLNDAIGSNTVDENLNIGDIVEEEFLEYSGLNSIYYCIMSTWNPYTNGSYYPVSKYNNNLWGGVIYFFTSELAIRLFLQHTNQQGHIGDVQNMFIVPQDILNQNDIVTWEDEYNGTTYTFYTTTQTSESKVIEFNLSAMMNLYNFSDFSPKNNKCKVYPYNYLYLTNNIGNQNIYRIEDFSNGVKFNIEMALSIGASIRAVPINYKKIDANYDECLPLAKFPTCGWSADSFTNWLTQNSVNIATNLMGGAISSGVSLATGNIVGSALSIAGTVANTIGQFYQASLLPAITGGNNTGDVNFSSNKNTFIFRRMRAKTEFLKIIDDYFTRFGYAIKKLDNPHLTGRRYWNYIEIGMNESIGYGSVPSKYMEEINGACRKGVTIWHEHDNLGDFSLNNTIV